MSIDYEVFSKSENPLSLAELEAGLQRIGWCAVFVDWEQKKPIQEGELLGSVLAYAWKDGQLSPEEIRGLREAEDCRKKLFERDALGCSEIYVSRNYSLSEEYNADAIEELLSSRDNEFREHLKAVRTKYQTRTSSGRNRLSVDFQYDLAVVIARLCGGLLDDPQTGTHKVY